ncbi:protein-L-isoaspartate(D-aspartate) O-methyltransferase [Roseiarcus fermentans]|uniref:Protein-L-isoaspartate O-methyltransferase n=1 Tax=Roseiarcus fermentans TaxID=1473586 RepID=A0A366FI81_9HYPH|nr:protein-L-isoaspartate O-methyltransferase [Roseiarcus fermentans]RBP14374.1 protein-L-isoaspartate(D-aspartate) O-methyltransferase [Roseiarcus fermentans]
MATTSPADGTLEQRLHMVNCQLRTGDVVDQEVLAAFLDTPREPFVPAELRPLAYLDRETPAFGAKTRRLLRPLTLARLLQAAAVNAGDRALDVGGGSGYGAALLDAMGAKVVALESDAGAAAAARGLLAGRAGVTVIEGPLPNGAVAQAPFDVIVVEGAFRVAPDTLIRQLADGGRLVGIDAIVGAPQAALYERRSGGVSRRALFEAAADVLDGFAPAPSFVF